MSRLRHILTLCTLHLALCTVQAQVTHLPGIWIGVGEHSLLLPKAASSSPEGRPGGVGYGVEGLVGADYAFTAGHFMMSMGAGLGVWHSLLPVRDMHAELPHSVDKNGYEFTFVYDITQRRDAYTSLEVQVPLMLGAEFGQFHFLLGGKFKYMYALQMVTRMQVGTYGDYPQFLDPFTGMSKHQYFDNVTVKREALNARSANKRDLSQINGVALNPFDVAASAELGWRLTKDLMSGHPALYLSVYADVGLLNYNRGGDWPLLDMPATFSDVDGEPNMVARLGVYPALGSKDLHGAFARHLAVGVKLAVRFPHTQKHRYPCKCLQENYGLKHTPNIW